MPSPTIVLVHGAFGDASSCGDPGGLAAGIGLYEADPGRVKRGLAGVLVQDVTTWTPCTARNPVGSAW